jgi:HlyD family secretion protein
MKRIIGILALLAGVAALIWFFALRDTAPKERFVTSEASRGSLTEEITANGIINPVRVVNVGSQVSGTVEKLYVDFNDRVTAGQVLLELDPRLFRARLAQSEASLANVQAQAALAESNAKRASELRRQDFISRQDYDQAVASARSSAAQVASARAAVDQDRANLGFSIIRSPVSGVIISRQVDIGQTVAASFQTPTLFTIARDLTQMQIEASVAEADISRVQVGQRVSFTVDAFSEREFVGTVSQVRLNPTTQQNVVTFTVVVDVPNPDGALLPGMTVNARFLVKEHANALLVPNAAMSWKPADWTRQRQQAKGGEDEVTGKGKAKGSKPKGAAAPGSGFGTTIFVLGPDGEPQPRRIRLGASDNDSSIVLGGELKAGEKVITGDVTPDEKGGRPGRSGGGGGGNSRSRDG